MSGDKTTAVPSALTAKDVLYHVGCGGRLIFSEIGHYGYFDAEVFQCVRCGASLELANDYEYMSTSDGTEVGAS